MLLKHRDRQSNAGRGTLNVVKHRDRQSSAGRATLNVVNHRDRQSSAGRAMLNVVKHRTFSGFTLHQYVENTGRVPRKDSAFNCALQMIKHTNKQL